MTIIDRDIYAFLQKIENGPCAGKGADPGRLLCDALERAQIVVSAAGPEKAARSFCLHA